MEYEVKYTEVFEDWLRGLRDLRAAMKITARLRRVELGNLGDSKSVGSGVSELRINVGKGYRVYYTVHSRTVLLLCGGDKSNQAKDIRRAHQMLKEIQEHS